MKSLYIKKWCFGVFAFFFSLAITPVFAQHLDPSPSPRCYFEELARNILLSELSRYRSGQVAVPPGELNMSNAELKDPKYDPTRFGDPYWVKYEFQLTTFTNTNYRTGTATKLVTSQHYMVNLRSRTTEDYKFISSNQQGCIGKTVSVSQLAGGRTVDPASIDSSFFSLVISGHWEWYDYYSNGEYTGSDDFEYIVDSVRLNFKEPKRSTRMMN